MSANLPSLFLSAERSDALSAWRSPEMNVANLRLPVDAAGAYPAALDRLAREACAADPSLKALSLDLDRIVRFVRGQFVPGARRGLCVVSCVKYGLFEAFASPEPLKAELSVSARPELSALSAVRRDYKRFLVLLADARQARFLELHLGESCELEALPGNFAGGGLAALAARSETLRRARRADRFVLGAPAALHAALEPLLSPELRGGLILEPLLGPDRPAAAVAERVAHNEREARKVREAVLVQRFLDELRGGGAVAGLEAAAAALQQGCARLLLVRDGYAKMGRCCGTCGRLSVNHRSCPWCFRATLPVMDLVAELADRASAAGVEVFRVGADARFDAAGRIGVCLGVPPPARRPDVPTARALRGLFAQKRASLRPRFA
ncbi:MAG TPA: hypothetical protein VH309_14005 [Elusimicrobiota bacterium]|jgi:hypothetical protein|nr:hypothetical protein [Elusimicrobiota bacterium]